MWTLTVGEAQSTNTNASLIQYTRSDRIKVHTYSELSKESVDYNLNHVRKRTKKVRQWIFLLEAFTYKRYTHVLYILFEELHIKVLCAPYLI